MNVSDKQRSIFNSVVRWQLDPKIHPLTCGNDSDHSILEPVMEDGVCILKCPQCGYIQRWIPTCIGDEK